MSGIIGVSPDMRSGVIGAFPSGQIIQVNNAVLSGTGAAISHSGGWADTGLATSFATLKQANTKILMQFSMCLDFYTTDSAAMAQCEDSIAGATYAEIMDSQAYLRNDIGTHGLQHYAVCAGFIKTLSNSVGDSYNIKVRVYETSGDVRTHYNTGRTSRRSHLTIYELAV